MIVLKRKLFIKRSQTDLASDVRGSLGPKLKRKRKPYLTYQHGCGLNHWQHRASKMLVVLVYHASLVRRMICRHAGMGAVRKPVTNALPGLRPKATWYLYNIILVKSVIIYSRFSAWSQKRHGTKLWSHEHRGVAVDSPILALLYPFQDIMRTPIKKARYLNFWLTINQIYEHIYSIQNMNP